ncbi:BMP family ABC transporter substrate-binding protein [Salibacterium salarium]|uniref:BMP family ABC transporter substrate-binding protein n=1 Tax=Salibacterium salarium TaxID=284579 RepID=A0A3R9QIA0_9BACI|nr:BMP family ABC transporter substrate-binding protein [Salibacterium salarium]RSL31021.1 BMP family ABC transporter substrate-binding protein [Salibacterium salarium]
MIKVYKKAGILGAFGAALTTLTIITACNSQVSTAPAENKAALLLENTIDEQGWNNKGYEGLLNIQSDLGMDVTYEENISDLGKIKNTVKDLEEDGVELIFGHGKFFAEKFMEINGNYPDIHFVSFNGDVEGDNITSVQFEGYAMGYFAGKLSSQMTDTNTIGVISAQKWQPEAEGFVEGAKKSSDSIKVLNENVGGWDKKEKALQTLENMTSKKADIIYPAGNGFHVEVINEVKGQDLQAIGYIGDQSDLGETTVLTSTVQHVDEIYRKVAKQYQEGELESGNVSYDFAEGAISMGTYSSEVPEDVQQELTEEIEHYKETGELP